MESFKPILEKIKKIKQEKGYTNEVLAQKSGIPLSTLNKILSSVIKDPKIGTLIAITDALDVDINSLIYDNLNIKDKPNPKTTDNLEKLANEYNLNIDDISFITKKVFDQYTDASFKENISIYQLKIVNIFFLY